MNTTNINFLSNIDQTQLIITIVSMSLQVIAAIIIVFLKRNFDFKLKSSQKKIENLDDKLETISNQINDPVTTRSINLVERKTTVPYGRDGNDSDLSQISDNIINLDNVIAKRTIKSITTLDGTEYIVN